MDSDECSQLRLLQLNGMVDGVDGGGVSILLSIDDCNSIRKELQFCRSYRWHRKWYCLIQECQGMLVVGKGTRLMIELEGENLDGKCWMALA